MTSSMPADLAVAEPHGPTRRTEEGRDALQRRFSVAQIAGLRPEQFEGFRDVELFERRLLRPVRGTIDHDDLHHTQRCRERAASIEARQRHLRLVRRARLDDRQRLPVRFDAAVGRDRDRLVAHVGVPLRQVPCGRGLAGPRWRAEHDHATALVGEARRMQHPHRIRPSVRESRDRHVRREHRERGSVVESLAHGDDGVRRAVSVVSGVGPRLMGADSELCVTARDIDIDDGSDRTDGEAIRHANSLSIEPEPSSGPPMNTHRAHFSHNLRRVLHFDVRTPALVLT